MDGTMQVISVFVDDGKIMVVRMDAIDFTRLEVKSDHLDDQSDINEILTKASELIMSMDRPAGTPISFMGSYPSKNGRFVRNSYGEDANDLFINVTINLSGGSDDVEVHDAATAIAIASWETYGSSLYDKPFEQRDWDRSSRLLVIDFDWNHVNIGLVNNGRIIEGLSRRYDDLSDKTCSTRNMNDATIYAQHAENLISTMNEEYCPDMLILSFEHGMEKVSKAFKSIEGWSELNANMLDGSFIDADDCTPRAAAIALGSAMIRKKDTFGWHPSEFTKEADEASESDGFKEFDIQVE